MTALGWLAAVAFAQTPPSNLAVTSVGAHNVTDQTLGVSDPDLLLGQRIRWGLAPDLTLLANARFTLDPAGATTFEQSRVRSLGVAYEGDSLSLLAGRHALRHGGARLLDGAQVLLHPGRDPRLDVGAFAGFMADPFSTAPRIRPSLGPVLALRTSTWSASALGELVLGSNGFDRFGAIVHGSGNFAPKFFVNGRVDLLVRDAQGRSGLADAALSALWRPSDALRLEADANAFSSLRYQTLGALDPTVLRFQQRVEALDLQDLVLSDTLDPTLQQTYGAAVRVRPRGPSAVPVAGVASRLRLHSADEARTLSVSPYLGVAGLAGGRLELVAEATWFALDGRTQGNVGGRGLLEVGPSASVLLDASGYVLMDPVAYANSGVGVYADLFVDTVMGKGTVLAMGGSFTSEPGDVVRNDVGWGAFLRLQQWIRAKRPNNDQMDAVGDLEQP